MLRIIYAVQNHAIKTTGLMRRHRSWYILASEGHHRACGCSSLSHARLYVTLCPIAHQAPLPHKGPQTRPHRPGGQKSEITESAGQLLLRIARRILSHDIFLAHGGWLTIFGISWLVNASLWSLLSRSCRFLPECLHTDVPLCTPLCVLIFPFNKDTSAIALGLILMTSF